jgi:hypothetical protein
LHDEWIQKVFKVRMKWCFGMGAESGISAGIQSGAIRTGSYFASPTGRINLIVTGIFLIFLILNGINESVEQKSVFPLVDNTVLRFLSSDSKLGVQVDELESTSRPVWSGGLFSKAFPIWLWFWVKFWWLAIANLWMLYFLCWVIYGFWSMTNDSLILRNIIFTVITFLLISFIVGMMVYNLNLSGKCLTDNKNKVFSGLMINSYPLHGTIKFFTHFLTGDLFHKVSDWVDTPTGRAISGINERVNIYNVSNSSAINSSFNYTGG